MIRHDDFLIPEPEGTLNVPIPVNQVFPSNIRIGMLIQINTKDLNSSSFPITLYRIDLKGNDLQINCFLSCREICNRVFMVVRVGLDKTFLDFLWGDKIYRIFPREYIIIIPAREEVVPPPEGSHEPL